MARGRLGRDTCLRTLFDCNAGDVGSAEGSIAPNQRFIEIDMPKGTSCEVVTPDIFPDWYKPGGEVAREGARVRKHYHAPETPCARLLAPDAFPR